MRNRFWMQLAITALLGLIPAAKMLADVINAPVTVTETLYPTGPVGGTQYTIANNSNVFYPSQPIAPFDITFLLVTTNGSDPTTTNAGWTAETVDAATWDEPMDEAALAVSPADQLGGENSLTWQQYTGLTYTQAFPSDPVKLNAYFLDYTVDPQTGEVSFPAGPINGFPSNPVFPGNPIGGFYYTGAEDSTFLVGGPADGTTSFLPGNIVTYSGTTTDIPPGAGGSSTPLPSGLALGLTALAVVGLTIRRAWIGDAHQRG